MAGSSPLRSIARLVLAASLATVLYGGQAASAPPSVEALSRWTGGIDLYRSGVFTTQKSWLWCTAADVQIIRNIVGRHTDHSSTSQRRYFAYMRAHNRYRIPVSDGVDPAGWTAGLRAYVDSRYRLVASTSFDAALRSAVTNLRKTNRPVAITVSHGNHAWVLTGFTATADPATTSHFIVTSVRVVGPLWGLQSRSYGYDMRPDRKLTPSQLRSFFTPWHYARTKMAWEGRWVSIQAVATAGSTAKVAKAPVKVAPTKASTKTTAAPGRAVAPAPAPANEAAVREQIASTGPSSAVAALEPPTTTTSQAGLVLGGVALLVIALAMVGSLVSGARRRR